MKVVALLIVILTGAVLIHAANDMPRWSDPQSPASSHVSPHYITESLTETTVPNMVTAVLADYRGFDTMFETIVIFTAGIAVILIIGSHRALTSSDASVGLPVPVRKDLILQTSCRLMLPVLQLFGLYVVAHGHHSPGGGFQGGVILGASMILLAIAYNLKTALKALSRTTSIVLAVVGVVIFVGTGVLCVLLGGQFLDYAALQDLLQVSEGMAHSLGILFVEIGVAFTVMTIMFLIYAYLSSSGSLRRGI